MDNWKDKVAVVTGAGRGIGRASALALAKLGCRVALCSRTPGELEGVSKEIAVLGSQSLAQVCDVANETSVMALFERIASTWGDVDILVNNAAIFHSAAIVDLSVREWDEVMGVNAKGVFLCSREFFRQRRKTPRPGSIVNISSLSGVRGPEKFSGFSSYTASKFAVTGFTECLAVEGRKLGIRANCIAPGAVDTQMLRRAAPHLKTKTTPEEIARTVVYLADEERSGHITGTVMEIFSNIA